MNLLVWQFLLRRLMIIKNDPCQYYLSIKETHRKIVCLASFQWRTSLKFACIYQLRKAVKQGNETIGHN